MLALLFLCGLSAAFANAQAGGYVPVNPLDAQAVTAGQYAVDQMNVLNESPCYMKYTYVRVLKAYRQLVNGLNFALEVEVNTSMTGSCHIRYSDGLYILRDIVVYQSFGGVRSLTFPKTKENIRYVKEKRQIGDFCIEPDYGCVSDAVCLLLTDSSQTQCVARYPKGFDCEFSRTDDVCEIQCYCRNSAQSERQCMYVPPSE
jgi:hypothetical protein